MISATTSHRQHRRQVTTKHTIRRTISRTVIIVYESQMAKAARLSLGILARSLVDFQQEQVSEDLYTMPEELNPAHPVCLL